MKSNLSTFSFTDHAFPVMSKNSLPNLKSLESLKNFIFTSMIYLGLIFVQSVMFGSRFIFLTTDVQLFQHHLFKRLSFLHQIAFAFLSKVRSICVHLFLVFNLYAENIMRNAVLEEAQAEINIARRNINNLRYVDDTTLMAESEEELKSLLKVKEESEKVGLKLNIQQTKIMASGPITSWEIDAETVADFIFLGSKITADGDCSHEIKRRLLLGRKVMTNLDSILKS